MIPNKKQEHEPGPMELCPNFNKCSANLCPLDPDIEERPYVRGDDKCRANKPTRAKIADNFPKLLPLKGFTRREASGMRSWANRDPKEKKKFVERNTKRLKTLKTIEK